MMMPPSPWWIRLMDGGNARTYTVAAIAFAAGFMMGRNDHRKGNDYWKNLAQSYHNDNYHGRHTEREHESHSHHTEREHEQRQYRHGEGHER
jgi:hypothetical protein